MITVKNKINNEVIGKDLESFILNVLLNKYKYMKVSGGIAEKLCQFFA